jgi:hypothetical protein
MSPICHRCHHPGPHQDGPGAGPHYARLLCGHCSAFLRWLPKPRCIPEAPSPEERRRDLTTWADVVQRWTAQSGAQTREVQP